MAMWIDITMSDGTTVYVRASGGYAPDVHERPYRTERATS